MPRSCVRVGYPLSLGALGTLLHILQRFHGFSIFRVKANRLAEAVSSLLKSFLGSQYESEVEVRFVDASHGEVLFDRTSVTVNGRVLPRASRP